MSYDNMLSDHAMPADLDYPYNQVPVDLLCHACNGHKIKAIKGMRDRFPGMSLKEAKDLIDGAVDSLMPWERSVLAKDAEIKPVRMMTLYTAGPMRGRPDFNYPAFNALAARLRADGFTVNCPAENFGGDSTHEYSEYMNLDLRMVLDSDGIVLMPGWRDSEGARLEASIAKALGKKFYKAWLYDGNPSDHPDSWQYAEMETPEFTAVEGIDSDARGLVYGARNALYGPPVLDFTIVGRKWAATLSGHLQEHVADIPPEIVAVMLTDLKTSRQSRTPSHRDSRVDVIGYQLCLDRIVTNDGKNASAA